MPDFQEMHSRRDTAERVFNEMLTGVSPDVRQAMLALQELMEAEMELLSARPTAGVS